MDKKERYEHWLNAAENDLSTAEFMFDSNRYSYVTFMCQQAIEKLSKGIYVYTFDQEAKYTHNINIVLKDIEAIADSDEYDNYTTFFNELFMYYTVGRYDVYKAIIAENLNKENTKEIIDKTKEAFIWLKSQVKL